MLQCGMVGLCEPGNKTLEDTFCVDTKVSPATRSYVTEPARSLETDDQLIIHAAPSEPKNCRNGTNNHMMTVTSKAATRAVLLDGSGGYGHYRDQSCGSTAPLTKNCGNLTMDDSIIITGKICDCVITDSHSDGRAKCNKLGDIMCKPRERKKRSGGRNWRMWNFSLFSCHRDLRTCLCTMVCPYVTQYRIGANSGNPKLAKCLVFIVICMIVLSLLRLLPFLEAHFDFPASSFVGEFKWPIYLTLVVLGILVIGIRLYILAKLRKQIRDEREISGSRWTDHVTILFCFWCSLCQMKRELDRSAKLAAAPAHPETESAAIAANHQPPLNQLLTHQLNGTSSLNKGCYAPLNATQNMSNNINTTINTSSSNYDCNLNVGLDNHTLEGGNVRKKTSSIPNSSSMVVIGSTARGDCSSQEGCCEAFIENIRAHSLDEETFRCCCGCEQISSRDSLCADDATTSQS